MQDGTSWICMKREQLVVWKVVPVELTAFAGWWQMLGNSCEIDQTESSISGSYVINHYKISKNACCEKSCITGSKYLVSWLWWVSIVSKRLSAKAINKELFEINRKSTPLKNAGVLKQGNTWKTVAGPRCIRYWFSLGLKMGMRKDNIAQIEIKSVHSAAVGQFKFLGLSELNWRKMTMSKPSGA